MLRRAGLTVNHRITLSFINGDFDHLNGVYHPHEVLFPSLIMKQLLRSNHSLTFVKVDERDRISNETQD